MRKIVAVVLVAGAALVVPAVSADAATKPPVKYKNCTALNKAYKHGVGKPKAKDAVARGQKPVTDFGVNLALYTANKGLDRDKDGIACEKH